MSAPTAADLRAAALSDLRHPPTNANDAGLLAVLLPDIPGAPYGGSTTPEQRRATAEATDSVVQPQAHPAHLRALLRAWAASQPRPRPTPGSLREQIADLLQDNIPGFYPDHLRAADALLERYAVASRGKDNATGLRTTLRILQGLTEDGEPDLLHKEGLI